MKNTSALIQEFQKRLEADANSAYRAQISKLVPTGVRIIGVRVPNIRAMARDAAGRGAGMTREIAIELLDAAMAERCRELALLATFIVARFARQLTVDDWPKIDRWVDAVEDWEVCDQLAMNVAAPLVAANRQLAGRLAKFTRSTNPWRRRFAVATAAALNQKGRKMVTETLAVCEPLVGESESIVQKAVGWALREASQIDAATVFEFLARHRDSAHPRILREGSEKLSASQRSKLAAGAAAAAKPKRRAVNKK